MCCILLDNPTSQHPHPSSPPHITSHTSHCHPPYHPPAHRRYGISLSDLPHPEADWPAFLRLVSAHNDREPAVWNPVSHSATKWVDVQRLAAAYGPNKGFSAQVRQQGPVTGAGAAGSGGAQPAPGGGCCVVM